jgi:hypothetical protein
MKVGLPGVGIGGVFYVLLVAMMPLRELQLTWQGKSSRRRWRLVALQTSLAAAIILALGAEWWALARLPELVAEKAQVVGQATGLPSLSAVITAPAEPGAVRLEYLAPTLAAAPFAIIGFLVGGLHALRWLVRRRSKRRSGGASREVEEGLPS